MNAIRNDDKLREFVMLWSEKRHQWGKTTHANDRRESQSKWFFQPVRYGDKDSVWRDPSNPLG
jgi:hypothetical protein